MARLAPNNITVRQKLADTYLKIGYIDLGLGELEILAELQRKAGLVKDAVSPSSAAPTSTGRWAR